MERRRSSQQQNEIPQAVLSQVAPAVINSVSAEDHLLLAADVAGWRPEKGPARIRSSNRGVAGALVHGALDQESLVVRHQGTRLIEGQHFVVDAFWGSLEQGTIGGRAGADGPERLVASGRDDADSSAAMVQLSYDWSERRIDAIGRDPAGRWQVWPGSSHLSAPVPAAVPADHEHVANVFVDHFDQTGHLLLCRTGRGPASEQQLNRLPRIRAALANREPLRIACWGDSVTVGGDASAPSLAFPALLRTRLAQAWDPTSVQVGVIAVDGSSTSDWLKLPTGDHESQGGTELTGTDLNALIDFRPDLVITEFVNDASLDPSLYHRNYEAILELCRSIGADLILTTPHFTAPPWMGDADLGGHDQRSLTIFLRDLAQRHGIAVADVSRRWERLYDEGIPYPTLLNNGVNHPDDRGHQLAAAEIAATLGVELRPIGEPT